MAQTLGSFKNDFIWGGRWYYPRLLMEITMDGKRCISISESGDENEIANKSKIHVRGELILFCLSTPKFMHFAYLFRHLFIRTNMYFIAWHSEERFVTFWAVIWGGGGDEAPKVLFLRWRHFLMVSLLSFVIFLPLVSLISTIDF